MAQTQFPPAFIILFFYLIRWVVKSFNETENEKLSSETTQLQYQNKSIIANSSTAFYTANYRIAGVRRKLKTDNCLNTDFYEEIENDIPELEHYYVVNGVTIFTTFRSYYEKLLCLDTATNINYDVICEAYKTQRRAIYQLKDEGILIANYLKDLRAAREYMICLCAYLGNKN